MPITDNTGRIFSSQIIADLHNTIMNTTRIEIPEVPFEYTIVRVDYTIDGRNIRTSADINPSNHYTSGSYLYLYNHSSDYIEGNRYSNWINIRGRGNDIVDAGAGNDYISTDRGHDTIHGGSGRDNIYSGNGNDIIDGGSGNDYIRGQAGNDVIEGGSGNDRIFGEAGNDRIRGGSGNDTISALWGNNTLDGYVGNNTITAGSGDDIIMAGAGRDRVTGGAGNDVFVAASLDFYVGHAATMTITDFVVGQDTIAIRPDITYSHTFETLLARALNSAVQVNNDVRLEAGGSTIVLKNVQLANLTADSFTNYQTVDTTPSSADIDPANHYVGGSRYLYNYSNDYIEGNGSSNWINSRGRGDDIVDAGAGNDYIFTDRGHDTIDGGSGRDYIRSGNGNDIIDGGSGNDDIRGQAGNDVIEGGSGNDKLIGEAGNDWIRGGAGNDRIQGDWGNDVLDGHAGNNKIYGGSGNDIILGGTGTDTVYGGSGNDVFVAVELIHALGSGGNMRVKDFADGEDLIGLISDTGFSVTFEDMVVSAIDSATQVGSATRFEAGGGTITLDNFQLSNLSSDHFIDYSVI